MIRMALHVDYYKGHATIHDRGVRRNQADDELLGAEHIDHCIDSIRQSLTCNADISAITWSWDRMEQRYTPQATVSHVCKRFDKIREWAKAHAAQQDWDDQFRVLDDPLDPDTWTDEFAG